LLKPSRPPEESIAGFSDLVYFGVVVVVSKCPEILEIRGFEGKGQEAPDE
jgi:hypothetical protein